MTWPRGSRFGSEKTPTSRFTRVSRPVSSRTSRTTASTVVSPSSTNPPGSAGIPRYGSFMRRTATSFPSWRTIPSTATEGCAPATMASLAGGHPDAVLVRCHHAVDRLPELRPLPVGEPTYARGEAFPREVLLREADPPSERLIARELAQDDAVRLDDVVRTPGHRDPSERTAALREERADEQRHEALEGERVFDAGLFRLTANVVPVVEDDAPGPEEIEHRLDVDGNRIAGATHVLLGILGTQCGGFRSGQTAVDVSSERVVGAGLVRHDVRTNLALHHLGMDVGAVPDEPDRERSPARLRVEGHFQGLVEFEHDPIAVSVRHPPSDAVLVDFHF